MLLPRAGARASAGRMTRMSDPEDLEGARAPICPCCGVTALPAETSNVIDSGFVCENPDCEAFGDIVASWTLHLGGDSFGPTVKGSLERH